MTQTEALLEIARRNGGTVTPAKVLEEARDVRSVLHGAFTWDDHEAAEKYRIIEAQNLIRHCRIVVGKGSSRVETYAFVGLSTDRNGTSRDNPYRLAADVAKCVDLLQIAVKDALLQLESLRKRYSNLSQLDDIWASIDAHLAALRENGKCRH